MLSSGGPRALAHIGAIDVFVEQRHGRPADCIVGASMGALVGGLHAADANVSSQVSYQRFADAYADRTRAEASERGGVGALLGLVFGLATGGAALLAGPVIGGLAGATSGDRLDIDRFEAVLRDVVGGANVEDLGIAFASLHLRREDSRMSIEVSRTGSLAAAVSASVANPLVFDDVDIRDRERLDAAADRVAAVPVEYACSLFPDAFLVVVNATGEPAFYSSAMTCPLLEIRIETGDVPIEAMAGGSALDEVIERGRAATLSALQ